MIVKFERNGLEAKLKLPCSDAEMFEKMQSVGVSDPTDTVFHIETIASEVSELSRLNDSEADLDHLNLLARLMDGMWGKEFDQFRAALCYTQTVSVQGIVNLTQNLGNYTLIKTDESLEKAGLDYYLDLHGSIAKADEDKNKLAALARELIASGNGYETPYGTVYDNGMEIDRFFNGETIPMYYDRDFICVYEAQANGKTEYLVLPCDEISITKAAHRLGLSDIDGCALSIDDVDLSSYGFREFLESHTDAPVSELNMLTSAVSALDNPDIDKLMAVFEYTQAVESNPGDDVVVLTRLAENIDSFEYAPGATETEELGRYLIQASGHYAYDSELDAYYDYEALGTDKLEAQDGRFIKGGYVGISDDIQLYEILDGDSPQMGGIQ
ncbi:MAG TPA: hypothetical protein PLT66_06465 [Bacillota bacterium]|nr:hypothetical protein [Bacillota bacterium]